MARKSILTPGYKADATRVPTRYGMHPARTMGGKKTEYVNIAGLRDAGKRNQPCPCGSGLKYKKCCLNKRQVRTTPTAAEAMEKAGFKVACDGKGTMTIISKGESDGQGQEANLEPTSGASAEQNGQAGLAGQDGSQHRGPEEGAG